MKKQICILGSTGSIGTQALDVIQQHQDIFEVYCLTQTIEWNCWLNKHDNFIQLP